MQTVCSMDIYIFKMKVLAAHKCSISDSSAYACRKRSKSGKGGTTLECIVTNTCQSFWKVNGCKIFIILKSTYFYGFQCRRKSYFFQGFNIYHMSLCRFSLFIPFCPLCYLNSTYIGKTLRIGNLLHRLFFSHIQIGRSVVNSFQINAARKSLPINFVVCSCWWKCYFFQFIATTESPFVYFYRLGTSHCCIKIYNLKIGTTYKGSVAN